MVMEMNRRRSSRGFMIAKLMPFCKSVKPPPSPTTPNSQDLYNYNNNVQYYTSSSSSTASYAPQPDHINNYYVTTSTHHLPPKPKVSFLLQPSALAPDGKDMEKKLNTMAEKLIGSGINAVDECVDARAASYIFSVRERFKLDHCERLTTVINLDDDEE